MSMSPHASIALGTVLSLVVVAGALTMKNGGASGDLVAALNDPLDDSALIVAFERNETALSDDALANVVRLAERTRTDSAVRVLIHGFANEESGLGENLRLAEARARSIADVLLARAVPRGRIVVAAAEAAPNDQAGGRSEVHIARGPGKPHD